MHEIWSKSVENENSFCVSKNRIDWWKKYYRAFANFYWKGPQLQPVTQCNLILNNKILDMIEAKGLANYKLNIAKKTISLW